MFGDSALSDLWVGLIGSIVFTVSAYFAGRGRQRWKDRLPGRRLWRLQDEGSVTLVMTQAPISDAAEYSDLVYPAEARAVGEIESFLHRLYRNLRVSVALSSSVSNEGLRENLILIGGPVHNTITRDLLQRMAGDGFSAVDFDSYSIKLNGTQWTGQAQLDSEENICTDVGVIIMAPNPYNPKRRLILLAGSRTFGCLAAARAIIRSDAKATSRVLSPVANYACFAVTADVRSGEVFDVRVDPRSITKAE